MLGRLLEGPDSEWRLGLETLCRVHPELATELRARFVLFTRFEDGGTRNTPQGAMVGDGISAAFAEFSRLVRRALEVWPEDLDGRDELLALLGDLPAD